MAFCIRRICISIYVQHKKKYDEGPAIALKLVVWENIDIKNQCSHCSLPWKTLEGCVPSI